MGRLASGLVPETSCGTTRPRQDGCPRRIRLAGKSRAKQGRGHCSSRATLAVAVSGESSPERAPFRSELGRERRFRRFCRTSRVSLRRARCTLVEGTPPVEAFAAPEEIKADRDVPERVAITKRECEEGHKTRRAWRRPLPFREASCHARHWLEMKYAASRYPHYHWNSLCVQPRWNDTTGSAS
jgi:hypothetical protein